MGALRNAFSTFMNASYWKATSKLGKGFGVAYPPDATRVEAYIGELDRGNYPATPPANLVTQHAQGLVGMLASLAAEIPAPTPDPPPMVEVAEFGNFADGTIDGDFGDVTQNWNAKHVAVLAGGQARVVADDSVQIPAFDGTGQKHVRVHGLGFKQARPWFTNHSEAWRALSILVPNGYSNTARTVTDEVHADNGTGPAPLNLTFERNGFWRVYIRGSSYPDANPPGGYPFSQTIFGPRDGGAIYDGTYFRHQRDWVGGNKPVVLGERLNLLLGWCFSPDQAEGWFEGWYSTGTAALKPFAPRTPLATSYPDIDGNGSPIYPMMSLYYDVGGITQNAVEYEAGAWWRDRDELAAWQAARLGLTG